MQTKHLFLTAILLVFSMLVVAAPVDPMRALEVAEQFAPQQAKGKGIKSKTTPEQSYEIVYTHRMPNSDRAAFFVVKLGEKGFVIISANDVANPILGYSYTNSWPTSISAEGDTLLPPQVLSYLNDMALQIETAIEKYPSLESSEEWNNVGQKAVRKTSARKSADALPDSVGPLLTTTWGQGQYYNALCPEDANGEDGHVPTGCVATAMAQIINYWGQKEEIKTRGIHSYDSQYGNLTVNYDSTSYDFTNMPDALTAESTPEQINAVAKLMYECGVAVNMQYDTWASGAYNEDVPSALINHFAFAYTLGLASRTLYSNVEWKDSLRANIQRGEPICYSGNDVFASHAFVLDGYTHNDYFHFNFGWNGDADGWYLIDAINPSYGFNYWQTAIMGIRPNQDLQTVICHSGHSQLLNKHQFNVTEPIDVYSYRKGSNYIAINERLSKSFVTFTPEDSSEQLVLDMLEIDKDQAIVVYDGASGDSLVRVINTRSYHHYEGDASDTVFQNMAGTDFSPIVSTRHGLKIVTYSNERLPYGFHLRVSNASDCRMVSNLQIHETADGFHVSWKNNGDATSWQVKVGNDIYTCDTTYIQLKGLSPNTSYTIQVRSVCGENYSSWNSIEVNKRVYWTDLVKSEPDGYFLNGDTIHITSSEGLAWISHIVDSLYWKYEDNQNLWEFGQDPYLYKVISIENDLNLGDYQWTTIREWRGHVCGNNHVINNLNSENLFGNIFDANISDVSFQNSNLNVIADAGAIAGSIHNCIVRNCSSINYRISSSESNNGGLFGNATDSKIINCYAYGEMYGLLGFGGLIGVSYNSEILNCVTSLGESFNWSEVISGHTWRGLITEGFNKGAIDNCFADINKAKRSWGDDNNPEYVRLAKRAYFLGNVQEVGSIENLAVFNSTNTQGLLLADTAVNYTLADHKNVVDALNDYVKRQNDSTLRTWRWDEDLNLPVLDAFYQVTCPNVSDIQAENIAYQDGFAVVLSWKENGDAQEWQVKYKITNQPDSTTKMFTTNTTIDTIKGLTLGEEYTFFVRPICDIVDTVGWGDSYSFFVDKIYWKDVVTSQPEGYYRTDDGNILVSSAEGLVWFVKTDILRPADTLFILNDINMEGYRWSPIGTVYGGVIEGAGHTISNINCNENINNTSSSEIGFISYASDNTTIQNLIIKNSSFIGNNKVGSIFGTGYDVNIINCHVIDTKVQGVSYIGGLGGYYLPFNDACKISNCSASGIVLGDNNTGGLVGEHWRATISNCYTNCNLLPSNIRTTTNQVGGLMGYSSGKVYNCYSTSQLNVELQDAIGTLIGHVGNGECKFIYAQQNKQISQIGGISGVGTIIADTSSFINNQLQSAITIGNSSYTNLLEALNAWVDANNSEGQYLHWVEDTANVNDGYPILKQEPIALPKYIITFCNDDGTILQQDTLELGEMPEYRGGIPTKDSTEQYNYTFIGWYQELVPATKDVTYYAQYESTLNQYEINFYDWDGTLLQSTMVNYGEWPAYYNSDPWREADAQYTYNFSGWSPELSVVTGNQSYTAQYEATLNQYEINFYNWDGTLLQSSMVNYGEWPTYYNSEPTRESDAQYTYTFTGWSPELDWVTGAANYYAQYESTLNQYEITFYDWDGTLLYSGWDYYGDYPFYGGVTPTRESDAQYTYTFTGWSPQLDIVTGHQSYYAQYEATLNQYEITFLNWDGEVLQSTMVDYGAMPEYFGVTPTKPEDDQYVYTFSGWEPEITIVVAYAEYTAQYDATDKVTTVIENTQSDEVKTYKILRNNKIFIIRGDKVYSILGHVIEDWMPLGL